MKQDKKYDNLKLAEFDLLEQETEYTKELIKNKEKKYLQFLNFLPVIVFECDTTGILIYINTYGKKKLKIVLSDYDINIFKLIKLTINLDFLKSYSDKLYIAKDTINEYETEITLNDEIISLVTRLEIFKIEDKYNVRGICFDITKQKRSEIRLSELSKCFLSFTTDPENNISKLVKYIGKQTNADGVTYNKLDNNFLCCLAKWNISDDYYPVDSPEGHICTDVIIENKNFIYIEDLNKTKYKDTDKNVKQYDLKTYIAYAVKFQGYNIGCLSAVYKEKKILSDETKWLLSVISSAIAIEESRRCNYDSIAVSNNVLNTTLKISTEIMSKDSIDIKNILEFIGIELLAKKVFLLRFPILETNYIDWIRPGFEFDIQKKYNFEKENENYDIAELLNWIHTGEPFCIDSNNYPNMFKAIVKVTNVPNYHEILVPILINNKPWGVMGIGQILITPMSDIVRTSFINLCRLITLIVRQQEERDKINNIIDKKMIEFKQKAKLI